MKTNTEFQLTVVCFLFLAFGNVKAQNFEETGTNRGNRFIMADFTADFTCISKNTGVLFTDKSKAGSGESLVSWKWSFSGKYVDPKTCTTQTPPPIYYYENGCFDVKLVVTNSKGEKDSLIKTCFINVFDTFIMNKDNVIKACEGYFFDSGGENANYSSNENYTMTFYPAEPDKTLQFVFQYLETYDGSDPLTIYDGINTGAAVIGTYSGLSAPDTVTASNIQGALTFRFTSWDSYNGKGWKAKLQCVDPGQSPQEYIMINGTVTTCNGLFYDSGGKNSNYKDHENYVMTFYPADTGKYIQCKFNSFDVEQYSTLSIYDGETTSSPKIGSFSTQGNIGTYKTTNVKGALTFQFINTNYNTRPGWEAVISCTSDSIYKMENRTVTTCTGTFYDSGGKTDAYGNDENAVMTFLPDGQGKRMECSFSSFFSLPEDTFLIYNGPSVSSPLIGKYDSINPGVVTSTHKTGALTFCFHSDSKGVESGWKAQLNCVDSIPIPEICMVTVDTISGKNMIIWEKKLDKRIASYTIYREGSITNVYDSIGNVSSDSLSFFIDNTSFGTKAESYKISIIDTSGNESGKSPFHRTIHLHTPMPPQDKLTLVWDKYIDEKDQFIIDSYKIYRKSSGQPFKYVTTVSGNTQATDIYTNYKNYFFVISAVKHPPACSVSKGKDMRISFSESFSNSYFITGINDVSGDIKGVTIYPNPFSDKTTIEFDNPTQIPYSLKITDITGKVLRSRDNITDNKIEIERNGLPAGLYFVEVKGEKVFRGKMVVE